MIQLTGMEIPVATCPKCNANSRDRDENHRSPMVIEQVLFPAGEITLHPGVELFEQNLLECEARWKLSCRCGWKVWGRPSEGNLEVVPEWNQDDEA